MKGSVTPGLLCLLLAGCGGPAAGGPDPITGVNPDGTPRWVNRGSGAYDGKHGKAFYGVGIATGVRNPALLRQTAGNRARGEVAKIFDTYIAAMMKDYQRSTTAGDFSASAEEQDIVSAQKTITEVTLRGVEVRDHWRNPRDGSLYALAVLDLGNVAGNLDRAKGLDRRVRDYVRANARRAFNDLDRELHRRNSPAPAPPPPPPPREEAPPPQAEAPPPPPPRAEPRPAPAPPPPPAPAARSRKPRVGLRILGNRARIIQTCFAQRITAAGYALYENTSDVDVMVRGRLHYARAGRTAGSVLVNARVEVRVTDMDSGRTNAAVLEKIKVGRHTLNESVQLAVSRLCDRTVPKIMAQIRAALR
jgi:hypothetical protein